MADEERGWRYAGAFGAGWTLIQYLMPDLPPEFRAVLWVATAGCFVYPVWHSHNPRWNLWLRLGATTGVVVGVFALSVISWPKTPPDISAKLDQIVGMMKGQSGVKQPPAQSNESNRESTQPRKAAVSAEAPKRPIEAPIMVNWHQDGGSSDVLPHIDMTNTTDRILHNVRLVFADARVLVNDKYSEAVEFGDRARTLGGYLPAMTHDQFTSLNRTSPAELPPGDSNRYLLFLGNPMPGGLMVLFQSSHPERPSGASISVDKRPPGQEWEITLRAEYDGMNSVHRLYFQLGPKEIGGRVITTLATGSAPLQRSTPFPDVRVGWDELVPKSSQPTSALGICVVNASTNKIGRFRVVLTGLSEYLERIRNFADLESVPARLEKEVAGTATMLMSPARRYWAPLVEASAAGPFTSDVTVVDVGALAENNKVWRISLRVEADGLIRNDALYIRASSGRVMPWYSSPASPFTRTQDCVNLAEPTR